RRAALASRSKAVLYVAGRAKGCQAIVLTTVAHVRAIGAQRPRLIPIPRGSAVHSGERLLVSGGDGAAGVRGGVARGGDGGGAAAWLTAEQQAAVLEQAATGAFHTAADVRRWIQEQFGLSYRPKGIYRLLKRLGCRPKVPRPVHEKANLAGQVAWKKGGSPR